MDSTPPATPETDPRNKKKYYFADTPQRRALIAIAQFLFKFVMEMEVVSLEHFPRKGTVILAANHVTNFDVFPMQFAVPRPIFFMGKAELFKNPVIDVLIRNLSGFPVNPEPGENLIALTDRLMFILARALLQEMRGVYAVVPEGFKR